LGLEVVANITGDGRVDDIRRALTGKKAAIYVGGAFKAFSLIKAFRLLGMQVVLAGSQTGTAADYQELHDITDPGTITVDDSNPLELSAFLKEKDVDIFVGGVKERPIAYKLGVGFCDHNHERKEALEGFVGLPLIRVGLPIGLRETDRFFAALEELANLPLPARHALERGRLLDAYVDGHKYIFGKKAVVYGEEDLVVGLTAFLAEIGVRPVLCASGGKTGHFHEAIAAVTGDLLPEPPRVRDGIDFYEISEELQGVQPDLFIGHSKGYHLAKHWQVPLIRVGFPIHDRFGGQRVLHLGYRGAQNLLDRIINAVLEKKQADSPVGYGYL
jgi:nitrogenase molybdenum-iron protein alpha/beta subunit